MNELVYIDITCVMTPCLSIMDTQNITALCNVCYALRVTIFLLNLESGLLND